MIVNALNQRFNLGEKLLIGFSFLHLDHLPLGMLLFSYLTLAILTDMQTVTLATELFVSSESSANLAVPFFFVYFLHHPVLSQ